MSESKHTPGPWVIYPETNGTEIYAVDMTEGLPIRQIIAHPKIGANWIANARLIAAAPELLGALRDLLHVYSEPDQRICCNGRDCGCMGATIQQEAEHYARAAIAKAEGR